MHAIALALQRWVVVWGGIGNCRGPRTCFFRSRPSDQSVIATTVIPLSAFSLCWGGLCLYAYASWSVNSFALKEVSLMAKLKLHVLRLKMSATRYTRFDEPCASNPANIAYLLS